MKPTLTRTLISTALFAFSTPSTHAQENLLQIYNMASANDPVVREARAQFNATHTLVADGRAQLLPNLTLSGNSARNTQAPRVVHSYAEGFNTHNWSMNLTQNLINFEAWFNFQSARESDRLAMTTAARAEQQLILRVAAAYFDVLRSQNNLALFQAQEAAAREVQNQMQQRYELGFAEISDVFDSQTNHNVARVSRLEEQNILLQRIQALEVITGRNHDTLSTLSEDFPVVSANPASLQEWLNLASNNNLDIKATEFNLNAAQFSIKAAQSAMLPTLTMNANYNNIAARNNPYAFLTVASESTAVGVTVSMPLSRGGANRSRLQRAYFTRDASREALERVERESLATTRNSYRSIEMALETVVAREETITFAENALEATEVGIEVGIRNTVDLLQAQRMLFQARRDFANARFDYVINTLELKQAAGTLNPQDVIDLNAWLE